MDVVNIKNKKYVRYKFRKKNGSHVYVYIENIGNEETLLALVLQLQQTKQE